MLIAESEGLVSSSSAINQKSVMNKDQALQLLKKHPEFVMMVKLMPEYEQSKSGDLTSPAVGTSGNSTAVLGPSP